MNNTLFDYLDDFCTAYLDNIIIYSKDLLEHKGHVLLQDEMPEAPQFRLYGPWPLMWPSRAIVK
jgi:hypothetical protein